MPGRRGPPTPAMAGACASTAAASVPAERPAPGWTTMPAGLSTTSTWSSSNTTASASDSGTSVSSAAGGTSISTRSPPRRRCAALGTAPSTRTSPPRISPCRRARESSVSRSLSQRSSLMPAEAGSTVSTATAQARAEGDRSSITTSARAATPTVIAESATLKAGQCQSRAYTSTKSTTAPKRVRSIRLPTAPPKMSPMADCSRQPPLGSTRTATRSRTTSATSERSPTTQRQLDGIPASRPNASPGFMTSVSAMKPSTTITGTPMVRRLSAISLVIWSSTTTTAAMVTTPARRDRSARIAGATEPGDDRHAALAERGVLAALAHALAARPAALALLAARTVHADDEAGDVLALIGHACPRAGAAELHARHDEDRRQECLLGGEERRQVFGRVDDPHRRLEPAADQLLGPGGLQRLGDLPPHLEQPVPVALERVVEPLARRVREAFEVHALASHAGHVAPRLLRGEREDRRHEPRQPAEDVEADGLGSAPPRVVGQRGVEPVLDDVEVERREVDRAEVVDGVEDRVELVVVVGAPDAADQPRQPIEDPAVNLVQPGVRLAVARGIEIAEVAEQEPERVAHAPVGVGEPLQDLHRHADVLRVVLGRHPQSQDLGTELRQDVVELDGVAEGLRHLPPLAVDEEAVGHDALVGRRVARAHGLEQRGLKPAAVLVRALEVELGRPVQLGPRLEDRRVAAAGVEPHVEDVRLLAEALAAALRAAGPRRQELARRARIPLVAALALTEDRRDVLDDALLQEERLAGRAVERDDRHTPHALARDDPLQAVRHHVVDAVLAPRRDPLHVPLDRLERAGAKAPFVELDEPLLGGAEERGVLAAPAVGVGVVERPLGDQHPRPLEVLDDLGIRLPNREPPEVLHIGDEASGVVHRVVDLEPERFPELVVLLAVAGRDVHEPGPLVDGDELRRGNLALARDPRMAEPVADQLLAWHAGEHGVRAVREQAEEVVHQRARHDVDFLAPRERDVVLRRMDRDREVGRQGPRRRGPDHRERRAAAQRCLEFGRQRRQRKLDPHRQRALVLVLHLGLRERGSAVHAPVDRLEVLVDEPASDEAPELARDHRLVRRIHRDVRIVPVAEHAQALELASLDVDEAVGVLATLAPLLDRIHRVADVDAGPVEPELFVDLVLDRQSVTVPARHVDRVEP